MQKLLLIILTLGLFLPNLFHVTLQPAPVYNNKERFDSSLGYIKSVRQLDNYTDSVASAMGIAQGTYNYVELLNDILERRFYHGFSHFSLEENWIAALAGKFIKEDYACKVQPEEILQHGNAACSQQALVMMQVLRNKDISYRSLGFPHHYALEAWIDGQWFFFDTNMEPGITKAQRNLLHWNHRNDIIKRHYEPTRHDDINYQFGSNGTAVVGIINEVPAKKASAFHVATKVVSTMGWILPLLILLSSFAPQLRLPSIRIKRKRPVVALQP